MSLALVGESTLSIVYLRPLIDSDCTPLSGVVAETKATGDLALGHLNGILKQCAYWGISPPYSKAFCVQVFVCE